jgi:hypothetical protein
VPLQLEAADSRARKGNAMTDYQSKFQQLLREIFQFDCTDLDFGIYRIMNYKRMFAPVEV